MSRSRTTTRKRARDAEDVRRKRARDHHHDRTMSNGAAAAERASAGMGTQDAEPTDWLFGNSLTVPQQRPH